MRRDMAMDCYTIYIYEYGQPDIVEEVVEMDCRQAMPLFSKPQWNSTTHMQLYYSDHIGSLGSLVERRPSPPGVEVAE